MNYRIINLTTRPLRQMLLRRAVAEDGDNIVVAEMIVPRGKDPNEPWYYEETVGFGSTNIPALQAYIEGYSDANAKAFYNRAKEEATKNTTTAAD